MKKSTQPVFKHLEKYLELIDKATGSVAHLVRPNIRNLKPYSSARHEFKGSAEVYLDANENPFNNGMNRYPDPLQLKVKKPLSKIKGVPVEHIFLGNGSDEPIDLLMRVFCEPGKDNIITLPPTYGMYQVSADINHVKVQQVNLTPDFQLDTNAILEAADEHSKILFICSPNNPTGNSMNRAGVEHLIRHFKGIIVIDEAYIDFSAQESCTEFIKKYSNVVVLQTFSKAWGMASIRLGMAFASLEIIELLNKVKPPYNVSELTQKAALLALQKIENKHQSVKTILQERTRLQQALPKFDFAQKVYPSDANFLLVKVKHPEELYGFLVKNGIIVRDRSRVALCEGCLRFTVGTPRENDRLLKTLTEYAKNTLS